MLANKIIVVTGGAGLLGRRFCAEISAQGGTPIVADLNLAAAKQVSQEIRDSGGSAEAAVLDITSLHSIENLISRLDARHSRIDAVVNNAYPRNKNWGRKLDDVTYVDFCENLSQHLGGYFLVSQRFSLYFRRQGGGNIVNMASIYAGMAPRFDVYANTSMTMPVEYAAIKSAIIQMTRYFSQYFKSDGVRCNTLSPGGIYDKQPEAFVKSYNNHCGKKGLLDAQDVTGVLLFLLSDASRYMTGQDLVVDDGFSL